MQVNLLVEFHSKKYNLYKSHIYKITGIAATGKLGETWSPHLFGKFFLLQRKIGKKRK